MALEVLREIDAEDVRLRWAPWPDDPHGVALLVGAPDADRWVLSAAHRRHADEDYARGVDDSLAAENIEPIRRSIVAFGVPWKRLTVDVLHQQAFELLHADSAALIELGRIPWDELEALRGVVMDEPSAMIYALGARMAAREATSDSTRGPSWC